MPMSFHSLRTLKILLCCMLIATAGGLLTWSHDARAAGATVQVWLTTSDGVNHLTPQSNLQFNADTSTDSSTISVNDTQQMQQMDGFGAAVTDSSAWLLANKISTSQRNTLMQNLFDPSASDPTSIGLSFVRIPMGASDFSVNGPYSYDDLPAGQSDPTLAHFSISHDTAYILPVLQQAYKLNPAIRFMANPWSPPAWMKTNDSMIGMGNGQSGTLNQADYGPLAQYFVKFLQAYQGAPYNLPIYAITPQNEPLYVPTNYPGMSWPASDESNFIKNNLAPALASANLHPKILGFDFNWSSSSYAQSLLSDSATNNDLAGIAWHCYGGDPAVMTTFHNQYPTKEAYETECSTGATDITSFTTINLLMGSVQNWAKAVELWNIALDPNDGPHTGGCSDCKGVAVINQSTGNVTYSNDYYILGQFSKFVVPGAYHVASSIPTSGNVTDVAFKDPNGNRVVVAYNSGSSSSTLKVNWDKTQSFSYTLPAGATVSFVWSGTTSGTPTPTPTGGTPTPTPTGGITSGATYTLTNKASGRVVDEPGNQTANGTALQVWDSNGGTNQHWKFTQNSDGSYTLTNGASGRVIDEPGNQTANGTALQIWDSNGGTNQHWKFTQNSDGSYTLTNEASGRVIDEPGNQTANGTPLQVWDSNGGANQHWTLTQI
jgi:glucosylceramidase